jgi:hypothetical protein
METAREKMDWHALAPHGHWSWETNGQVVQDAKAGEAIRSYY